MTVRKAIKTIWAVALRANSLFNWIPAFAGMT
jgi:hypothetical protein